MLSKADRYAIARLYAGMEVPDDLYGVTPAVRMMVNHVRETNLDDAQALSQQLFGREFIRQVLQVDPKKRPDMGDLAVPELLPEARTDGQAARSGERRGALAGPVRGVEPGRIGADAIEHDAVRGAVGIRAADGAAGVYAV